MSNSLPKGLHEQGNCSFENGHRCGDCHNASDTQVRTREYNLSRQKMTIIYTFLNICVSYVYLPVGSTREALYVVLGPSRCDQHLLISWVTLLAL